MQFSLFQTNLNNLWLLFFKSIWKIDFFLSFIWKNCFDNMINEHRFHWQNYYLFVFKKSARKNRNTTKIFNDTKMTNAKTNSIFKNFKNKFRIAAYLNFKNVTNLKKLRFHFIVLHWYVIFDKNCHQQIVNCSLKLLKKNSNLNECFSTNAKKLLTKYSIVTFQNASNKIVNNTNKDYLYAKIFRNLTHNLKIFIFAIFSILFDFGNIINQFEKMFKFFISQIKIFSFENVIQFSIFNFLIEFEEIEFERYNRINTIFKFVQCFLISTKWIEIFNINFFFYKSTLIFINQIFFECAIETLIINFQKIKHLMSFKKNKSKIWFFFEFKIQKQNKRNVEKSYCHLFEI